MFSFSAKALLLLAVLLVFFFSCSRESSDPPWEPQSHLGSKYYNGGLFPVWIVLKEPVDNASVIRWRTGTSRIAYRSQAMDSSKKITADTAFLYWEEAPQPFAKVDSVEVKQDTVKSWTYDTTYYYRDTVFAIVNGLESSPIVIEVKNILPRISKIVVGGLEQPGDSILTIAAHPGDPIEISIHLERPFKGINRPIVKMPQMMGKVTLKSESDSLWLYEWKVPNEVIATTDTLKVEDAGGYGDRLYKVHLIVYTEFGSVWVASEKEIVKYSSDGAEVARINDDFVGISDIAVNSNNGRLYVTDQQGNSFSIYDTYGKKLYQSTDLFRTPTGVAVDVEAPGYIWIADAKDEFAPEPVGQLRRFLFVEDSLRPTEVSYEMSRLLKGLSVNQFNTDFVWFAVPRNNTVGYVRKSGLEEPEYVTNAWNRPAMVSHDPTNGTAWVADSSRVIAIDTTGKILADIKGFGFVSSVSASKGNVWVSDIYAGKVYRFKGPFIGSAEDLNSTVLNGTAANGFKFISPISVSAHIVDGGAWVIDKEAGMAVRLDSLGRQVASGTGLKLPNLGKTLQKAE